MEQFKGYTSFENLYFSDQKTKTGYRIFISDIARKQLDSLSGNRRTQAIRTVNSLGSDPTTKTSSVRFCVRGPSGTHYLIANGVLVRFIKKSHAVLVNSVMSSSEKSLQDACPRLGETTTLSNIERAALAIAVDKALQTALDVLERMKDEPDYPGYHYKGFDSSATRFSSVDAIRMRSIVRELDAMSRYLTSTVGLDSIGRIISFLYDWFGPSITDKILKDSGFDTSNNMFKGGFGSLGALIKQDGINNKILKTEARVSCASDSGCEYFVNGKKFHVQ